MPHKMPGEHVFDDVTYMEHIPPAALDAVKEMTFRDEDVLLVTYPKAGTTWLSQIVVQLKDVAVETHIRLTVPILEFERPGEGPNALRVHEWPSPRVLSTHLRPEFYKKGLAGTSPKVLVLMRNPKDCLVSYFHYYRANGFLGKFQGDFTEFFQLNSNGGLCYGDVIKHIASWYKYKDDPRFLFLTYEEMKKDVVTAIKQISVFLEADAPEEKVQAIADETSFDKMSRDAKVNKLGAAKEVHDSSISKYLRKGTVGDWVNHFTEAQSEDFDSRCKQELEPLGITFDYELKY